MVPIIAGRFHIQAQAHETLDELLRRGFKVDELCTCIVVPRASHERRPSEAGATLASGARASALLRRLTLHQPGIYVAVLAIEYDKRVLAANVLRACGARDIERADGIWDGGRWTDFDAARPPRLIDLPAPAPIRDHRPPRAIRPSR